MFEMHGSARAVARPTCRSSSSLLAGANAVTTSTVASSRLEAVRVELPDEPTVSLHHELTENRARAVSNGAETVLALPHAASVAWQEMEMPEMET